MLVQSIVRDYFFFFQKKKYYRGNFSPRLTNAPEIFLWINLFRFLVYCLYITIYIFSCTDLQVAKLIEAGQSLKYYFTVIGNSLTDSDWQSKSFAK